VRAVEPGRVRSGPPTDLYDILACPLCKLALIRRDQTLLCTQCGHGYPIVDDVPVLLPDCSVPVTHHQDLLHIREGYDPWIHRVALQSLPASSISLEIGAGNMAFSLPNLVRMDVTLTPYVDVVGDAHALPILPECIDFIFSLAVMEHLRQPFVAAQEMYRVLRQGGYVFHDCSFVYPYHGVPHHYFNATHQGMAEIFAPFTLLRSGVEPYQMPSFALRSLLETYLAHLGRENDPTVSELRRLMRDLHDQPLGTFDGLFSEEAALYISAGSYYFGVKLPEGTSEVIPPVLHSQWEQRADLQMRFPNIYNLGSKDNISLWAKKQGRWQVEAVAEYFGRMVPFKKRGSEDDVNQRVFDRTPVVEPVFALGVDEARTPRQAGRRQPTRNRRDRAGAIRPAESDDGDGGAPRRRRRGEDRIGGGRPGPQCFGGS